MAILTIPDENRSIFSADEIKTYLNSRGIIFEQWITPAKFSLDATQEEVLEAYAPVLKPYMAENGYQTADVICIHPDLPNLAELEAKFLREHTHTEDEVRFFVEGQGFFWFNLGEPEVNNTTLSPVEKVFCLKCEAGDLISVPAGKRHWFEFGDKPFVKTIRIFTDASGWTPHYTDSGVDGSYRLSAQNQLCFSK